jgi:hypothetical protein
VDHEPVNQIGTGKIDIPHLGVGLGAGIKKKDSVVNQGNVANERPAECPRTHNSCKGEQDQDQDDMNSSYVGFFRMQMQGITYMLSLCQP